MHFYLEKKQPLHSLLAHRVCELLKHDQENELLDSKEAPLASSVRLLFVELQDDLSYGLFRDFGDPYEDIYTYFKLVNHPIDPSRAMLLKLAQQVGRENDGYHVYSFDSPPVSGCSPI